jgi:hypothetical protein
MLNSLLKFMNQVVFTCFLIYFIEISRETLPGNFLINKAREFAEFLIELLKKIVSTKL